MKRLPLPLTVRLAAGLAAALVMVGLPGLLAPPPARAAEPAAPATGETQVFALVVAHNRSTDPTVKPLRYADDDGARFFEWASTFATRVELLAVLDGATQKTFPHLVDRARLPSQAELRSAMDTLSARIAAARRAGVRTVFYFYFAGHGDVGADRAGYINLHDGRFSRRDLYREVIGRSGADTNHVIIDACNSYFLINQRGVQARRASAEEAMRSFLSQESLDRYPDTGVVLSTATAAESHEWSRYQSGIFSHQLLSALWGGADVDGNSQVSYAELSAYVAAANLRVKDSRARLSIYARPPRRDRNAPLVDLSRLRRVEDRAARPQPGRVAGVLTVPSHLQGHHYLEDDRGVRYADFNKTGEQPLRIALYDRPFYYLRSDEREAMIKLSLVGDQDAGQLAYAQLPTQSRGALEQSFRTDLYAFPFGRGFAEGHQAALDPDGEAEAAPAPRPWYARAGTWKWITLATSAGALVAGATLQGLSSKTAGDLAGATTHTEALALQDRANRERLGAAVGFGIAGTAAVGSVILFLIDRHGSGSPSGTRPQLGAGLAPGGGSISLSGQF